MEQFCHGTQGGWRKLPENPLLGGDLGTCFDISMLREGDLIRMYFSWRDRKNISVTTSADGVHWSAPETCIDPRETPDGRESRLNRPSIVKVGSIYHMWYTGQTETTSAIFHAVSEDSVRFTRTSDEPVLRVDEPWEITSVMCPSVLWDEQKRLFRIWYSGGEQYEPNAIGYAESEDGLRWRKHAGNPVFQADPGNPWEQHKTTACQVFYHDGWYRMFYIAPPTTRSSPRTRAPGTATPATSPSCSTWAAAGCSGTTVAGSTRSRSARPCSRASWGFRDRGTLGRSERQNSGTPMYGSRIRRENPRQPVGAGSACRSLPQPESLRGDWKVRIRELQCMVPEFVERTRGSKWMSALPIGNADQRFLGESRKTEDLGRSNLWRPTVVDRMRGS